MLPKHKGFRAPDRKSPQNPLPGVASRHSTANHHPVSVLVTAFGPFGNRTLNASTLVLGELRKHHPDIRTRIFPVDSVLAPSRLKQAIRLIRPSALLMLGESANCDTIQLESTAWNEKSFGIPDIKGRKPIGDMIRKDAPLSLQATLPVKKIYRKLDSLGLPLSISHDPGRYLCNQLFFTALDFARLSNLDLPALFIHVPLEEKQPIKDTARAITEVLNLIK